MENNHDVELARSRTRDVLSQNPSFRSLPVEDQRKMYLDTVNEELERIRSERSGGFSREMATSPPRSPQRVDGRASDLIDDARHEKGFGEGVEAFEDLVDSVDFPQFVSDLLKAVFDANMEVMRSQTQDYMNLMKQATTDLATFIKQVNNDDAKAYVAQNMPGYNILVEEDADGGEKIALTRPDGDEVDSDEEKALLAEAKIKMAQEHRAALREMILMGVTRLVVEKGEIEAEVNFEFKGKRDVEKKDKAMIQKDTMKTFQGGYNRGFLGSVLGGPSASYNKVEKQTQLSVSSTKSKSEDELKAKLRGYVNIKFKTDYFKLDNFAQMYGPPSPEAQQAALAPPPASAPQR